MTAAKKPKVSKFLRELPNQLTFLRILCIPALLIIYPMGTHTTDWISAWIYLFAAVTDFFDGYLARKYESITRIGMLLDPIADKMLSGACMILLAQSHRMTAWMAGFLLCRDIAISGIRLVALEQGITIKVSQLGKWKTFFQGFAICWLMIYEDVWGLPVILGAQIFLWLTFAVSLYSAYEYTREFLVKSKETLFN